MRILKVNRKRLQLALYPAWVLFILTLTGTVLANGSDFPFTIFLPEMYQNPWSTSFVDSPRYFSDLGARSVQFTAASRPCVVYGNDHLYYSCWNGGAWDPQVVDASNGVGRYATLALDSAAQAHIAYYDETNGVLRYAVQSGQSWRIERVTAASAPGVSSNEPAEDWVDITKIDGLDGAEPLRGLVSNKRGMGGYTAIALDSQGNPHISFYSFDNQELWYARRSQSEWTVELVDSAGSVGMWSSIGLTTTGLPSISYYDATNGDLKLASRSPEGAWSTVAIDSSGDVGRYSSLVFNAQNQVMIAYYHAGNHRLRFWDQASGVSTTILSDQALGMYASLRLDNLGRPWISSFSEAHSDLVMVYRPQTSWKIHDVDTGDQTGRFGSLAIDSKGQAGVVYYDSSNCYLRYAEGDKDGYVRRVIDTNTITGIFARIQMAGTEPQIVYLNDSQSRLMYAFKNNGVWNTQVISNKNDTGINPSLALGTNQVPNVTYWQYHGGSDAGIESSLRHTYRSNGSWREPAIVDDGIGIGFYSSLAVHPGTGRLHVSYYDEKQGNLKYAYNSGSGWKIQTVDSSGDVGSFTALAVDAQGIVWISYYDATHSMVKVARLRDGDWDKWVMDVAGKTDELSAIAIDNSGGVHVIYSQLTTRSLHHAVFNGVAWNDETLAVSGTTPSVVIGPGQRVYFSYYDNVKYDLGFAYQKADGWVVETVDTGGDVGSDQMLALGSDNSFHIAYLDATNGDLKIADRTVINP